MKTPRIELVCIIALAMGCSLFDNPAERKAVAEASKVDPVAIWKLLVKVKPGTSDIPPDVAEVLKKNTKVAGFMILNDVDDNQETREFLLTPIPGGCIHVPPPPPSYIVHVIMASTVPKTKIYFGPIEVSGKLQIPAKREEREHYSFEMIADEIRDLERQ